MRSTCADADPFPFGGGVTPSGGFRPQPLVLLVDDERDALVVLELALLSYGYRVVTAINGADAIDRAVAVPPAAVVTDLLMPVIDGIALAKALRSNPSTAGTRIVLCSGVPEGSVRPLFSHYDAFLRKPFEVDDLRETLAGLLPRDAR